MSITQVSGRTSFRKDITCIKDENDLILKSDNNPIEIANVFNQHFVSVAYKMSEKIEAASTITSTQYQNNDEFSIILSNSFNNFKHK